MNDPVGRSVREVTVIADVDMVNDTWNVGMGAESEHATSGDLTWSPVCKEGLGILFPAATAWHVCAVGALDRCYRRKSDGGVHI